MNLHVWICIKYMRTDSWKLPRGHWDPSPGLCKNSKHSELLCQLSSPKKDRFTFTYAWLHSSGKTSCFCNLRQLTDLICSKYCCKKILRGGKKISWCWTRLESQLQDLMSFETKILSQIKTKCFKKKKSWLKTNTNVSVLWLLFKLFKFSKLCCI